MTDNDHECENQRFECDDYDGDIQDDEEDDDDALNQSNTLDMVSIISWPTKGKNTAKFVLTTAVAKLLLFQRQLNARLILHEKRFKKNQHDKNR